MIEIYILITQCIPADCLTNRNIKFIRSISMFHQGTEIYFIHILRRGNIGIKYKQKKVIKSRLFFITGKRLTEKNFAKLLREGY